jgi:excisionase family DNA binding protein
MKNGGEVRENLTRREAAEFLRVSLEFLAADAVHRKHKVPFYRVGKRVIYRLSELRAWMESCAVR